jgi:hypothetical protein
MGGAYTPGLRVCPGTIVRKERKLPLRGQVVVSVGDSVNSDTVVARTEIPGVIQTLKIAEMLGLEPAEAVAAMTVKQGDKVEAGQVVARSKSFFGLFTSECKAPYTGTVELVSRATGHLGIRMPSRPVEVDAYIDGVVTDVLDDEGVVVETYGALIQGIFGVGGERSGRLCVAVDSPGDVLTEDLLTEKHGQHVVVGGSGVTLGALRKAASLGIKGIVVGAVVDVDLIEYLGHDIGVAITGQEDIVTTVILTEGFGRLQMANRTFRLLKSLDGHKVSINGATQIRAGVIRPEIIAPLEFVEHTDEDTGVSSLEVGTDIRVIRDPYFGALGKVTKLPPELVEIESGAVVRVLEAKLEDGREVTVPRANVEIIEG